MCSGLRAGDARGLGTGTQRTMREQQLRGSNLLESGNALGIEKSVQWKELCYWGDACRAGARDAHGALGGLRCWEDGEQRPSALSVSGVQWPSNTPNLGCEEEGRRWPLNSL